MKEFFKAFYHLIFFKPYTIYPRTFEIGLGILTWFNIGIIILGIKGIIEKF